MSAIIFPEREHPFCDVLGPHERGNRVCGGGGLLAAATRLQEHGGPGEQGLPRGRRCTTLPILHYTYRLLVGYGNVCTSSVAE